MKLHEQEAQKYKKSGILYNFEKRLLKFKKGQLKQAEKMAEMPIIRADNEMQFKSINVREKLKSVASQNSFAQVKEPCDVISAYGVREKPVMPELSLKDKMLFKKIDLANRKIRRTIS